MKGLFSSTRIRLKKNPNVKLERPVACNSIMDLGTTMSGPAPELYYLPPPPLPMPSAPSSQDDLPPPSVSHQEPSVLPTRQRFDPSRMIGIIRRKALVRDLAAVYHAECLTYCQGLLELQRKSEESYVDLKVEENSKKETMRPPKRRKIPR